jgi:Sulfotransferase family
MVLLIGGHPRSGTTLLGWLCDKHPAMSVTTELGSFLAANKPYHEHSRYLLNRWLRVWNRWAFHSSHYEKQWIAWRNFAFVTRYVLRCYRFRRELIDSHAIEAVLRSMFPTAKIVGDKWPEYVFGLDTLAGTDGVQLVIIYRDCRDVVSSTLEQVRTSWRGMPFTKELDSAEKIAARWVRAIELMQRHRERLHKIRYESLVQDPLVEIEALGRWLDVDPWAFPISGIRDASVGKHRTTLSPEELSRVMDVAGPTMRQLDYL